MLNDRLSAASLEGLSGMLNERLLGDNVDYTLTPEEKETIASYLEKWIKAGSTPVKPTKTTETPPDKISNIVRNFYIGAKLPPPNNFIYIEGPGKEVSRRIALMEEADTDPTAEKIRYYLDSECWLKIYNTIVPEISQRDLSIVMGEIIEPIDRLFKGLRQAIQDYSKPSERETRILVSYEERVSWACAFKYILETRKVKINDEQKKAAYDYLASALYASLFYPIKNSCIICNHPSKVIWNDRGLISSKKDPAIKFGNTTAIWCYQGIVSTNTKYRRGADKWEAEWIIEEPNPKLREMLILGIGYERAYNTLKSKKIADTETLRLMNLEVEDDWNYHQLLVGRMGEEVVKFIKIFPDITNKASLHKLIRVDSSITSAQKAKEYILAGEEPAEYSTTMLIADSTLF
jgi:hypothetical protein